MPRIDTVTIDDHILDKIEGKHGVTFVEAEAAVRSRQRHVRRDREGLYKIFSRTDSGRYLLVVIADKGDGVGKIVTAREMTPTERTLYRRARGGQ